jgi:hypothetical protein
MKLKKKSMMKKIQPMQIKSRTNSQPRCFASKKNEKQNEEIKQCTKDRRQPRQLNVGNYVLIPNQNPATKSKPRFKGPYKITAIYPNKRYRIKGFNNQHCRYDSVHASEHLKKIFIPNTAKNK